MRGSEVSLVSFSEGASGTGTPVPKGNTVFTDSANYLPPNSIAVAKVIVGVDAIAAGVESQTDPLPVVLRITGPARSVYDNGRLLTTNIAGCLVNGAARADLSSGEGLRQAAAHDLPAAQRPLRGLGRQGFHRLRRQDRGAGAGW
jgi:conjugal transfer pilus assembly protein TraB